MPNWCENDLTVSGPQADRDRFLAEKCRSEDGAIFFDFNKVIPYPEMFRVQDEVCAKLGWEECRKQGLTDGFNSGGYEWCCLNWGTKWPACEHQPLESTSRTYMLSFNTAWAPPIPVIKHVARAYPTLTFTLKWYERGMSKKGTYKIQGERLINETEDTYHGNRGG